MSGPHESILRKACGRRLHVDDTERLDVWRDWLRDETAPDVAHMQTRERRLLKMLLVQLLGSVVGNETTLAEVASILWTHPQARAELVELFDVLARRIPHVTVALAEPRDVPLNVHARYTRLEILAASEVDDRVKVSTWREGVRSSSELQCGLPCVHARQDQRPVFAKHTVPRLCDQSASDSLGKPVRYAIRHSHGASVSAA